AFPRRAGARPRAGGAAHLDHARGGGGAARHQRDDALAQTPPLGARVTMATAATARVASPRNAFVPVAAPGEFHSLRVGALSVCPPVVLAPMAGVTNYPFRRLCREFGAGLYVSEMITARGFLMMNRVTHQLVGSAPDERLRSVQIYGSDPADVET